MAAVPVGTTGAMSGTATPELCFQGFHTVFVAQDSIDSCTQQQAGLKQVPSHATGHRTLHCYAQIYTASLTKFSRHMASIRQLQRQARLRVC
jgi:hypothetical protein